MADDTTVKTGGLMGGNFADGLEGAVLGFVDGYITGWAITSTNRGAGGLLIGGINILIEWIVQPFITGINAGVQGLLYGVESAHMWVSDYRHNYGPSGNQTGTPSFRPEAQTVVEDDDDGISIGSYDINSSSSDTLLLASNNDNTDKDVLGLRSSMASFNSGSAGSFDNLNADVGLGSETILLAANY